MKRRLYALFLCLALAATAFASPRQALAALGKNADSVTADGKALTGVVRGTTARSGYAVQEVVSDANTVREFISPADIVFAIAWNGLSHPELRVLLGPYAGEYQQASKQTPRKPGRRSSQVKGGRVVVETWGHMRNLQGRAYVPALIPPGVSLDEIK